MQAGLALLWLLALAVSVVFWLYLKISNWGGRRKSRSQITGYELARQILDRQSPNRIAVTVFSKRTERPFQDSFERFALPQKIYYGTRLSEAAEALYSAVHHLESSKSSVPLGWRSPGGSFWQGAIGLSWILVFAGFLLPEGKGLTAVGQALFILTFALGLTFLSREWEAADRALSFLASLEGFGVDEKVRMKKLIKTIRWSPLAGILTAPFNFIQRRITFELPKSERVH